MTWPGSNRLREHPAWRHAGVPLEGWARYFPRFFPRLRLPPSSKNLGRNSPSNSRRRFPRLSSTFQRQLDARRAGTGIRACLDGERRLCGDAAQDFEDAFKFLDKDRNDMPEASSAKPFSGCRARSCSIASSRVRRVMASFHWDKSGANENLFRPETQSTLWQDQKEKSPQVIELAGFIVVEPGRIELPTSSLRTTRSPS